LARLKLLVSSDLNACINVDAYQLDPPSPNFVIRFRAPGIGGIYIMMMTMTIMLIWGLFLSLAHWYIFRSTSKLCKST